MIWIEKKILEQNSELLKKCRKSPFLTGVSPWFCSKDRTFYHVCFSGKPRKIRSLFNILDREEYFLDQKREVSKNVLVKISSSLPCGFFRQPSEEKIVF